MPETPQSPSSSQPPAEFHWGISYLREDFQNLRTDFQNLRTEVRAEIQDLRAEIRGVHVRIDDGNKRQDTHFRWLLTTMIALAGVIIAVLKT
ncbi:MAG: hypothetical protein HYW07_11945 [Candidatus Latescibacteria bacterium]|nr:hypothetical protein [Candidatus Latescibacterota bacterium]